jgi:hypothetical protein
LSKIIWTLFSYRSVLYEIGKGGGISAISVQIDATITLLLREEDAALLLKAMQTYTPDNGNEVQGRKYLLEVLEQIALPEDTRN